MWLGPWQDKVRPIRKAMIPTAIEFMERRQANKSFGAAAVDIELINLSAIKFQSKTIIKSAT